MRRFIRGLAGVVLLSLGPGSPAPAVAGPLHQPDGTPIPAGTDLQSLFQALGEPLDAIADAEVTPVAYRPTATGVFTVLARSGPYSSCLGWYNETGVKPGFAEMWEAIHCTDGVGTIGQIDFTSSPDYYGGDIGLAMAVGACANLADPGSILDVGAEKLVVFTHPDYTPGGGEPDRLIHVVVYASALDPTKLYFAFEDSLSGDNRFADLVVSLSGLGLAEVPATPAPAGLRVVPSILVPAARAADVVFELPRATRAGLEVCGVDGRRVRTLLAPALLAAGRHRVPWDGRDDAGRRAPPGLYFVRLPGGPARLTGRVIVL